ncbi:transcription factor 7-like isoform X2 [Sparus aurata]|uniref:transcription factor 7-like isoform X2 n=1 Tax=Sparus aurata TaxID=8175 RepID=UPI0011C1AD0A|nr:transcription factor 7-like isoform X2 [Sparus aurata]
MYSGQCHVGTMQPGHLHCQPGAYSQYRLYQWPVSSVPIPMSHPAGLQPEPVPSHSEVGGSGRCPPQRAAPSVLTATSMYSGQGHVGTMQPGHLHCQPGAYSQYRPYQWPVSRVPIPVSHPAGLQPEPEPSHSEVGRSGRCPPQRAAPSVLTAPSMYSGQGHVGTMQPGHLHCPPGAYSQYRPYQWPVSRVPIPVSHPAAPPAHTYNNAPMVRLPEGFHQNLQCVGIINGEPVFTLPAGVFPPSVPAAPQLNTSNSQEKKCESEQEDDRLYIKRPPNAFMLYIKEHRPHVEEDVKMMGNGAVNMVLGQRWKSLSAEERAVYYQQAQREKELHAQQHPGWSVRQNYGKKRKRESKRAPKASKRPSVLPVASTSLAAVTEDSTSRAAVTEDSTSMAAVTEDSTSRAAVTEDSTSRGAVTEDSSCSSVSHTESS